MEFQLTRGKGRPLSCEHTMILQIWVASSCRTIPTSMTFIKGRKKKTQLNSRSAKPKQIAPMSDETNDTKAGIIKKDMVQSTRSKLLVFSMPACIHLDTMCTEHLNDVGH